jgi:hypothetical protein
MVDVQLTFQIKCGLIDNASIEEDEVREVVEECKKLCASGKHEEAVKHLLPMLSFEWDWDNGDGDASDFFVDPSPVNFECNESNCTLKLGLSGSQLELNASATFSVLGRDDIDLDNDTLSEWLDENAMYACGFFNGGWSYSETDGDNVWVHRIED